MVFQQLRQLIIAKENPSTLKHSLRTAIAAMVSLLVARLFRLPETYWAAISTLIVMQSNLGAALPISAQRFIGTAVGAIWGGVVGTYFPANVAAFGVAVLAIGIACAALKVERAAYRYASITLAIVMLVPRVANEWVVAMHRFFEVSIGIFVGLVLSAVWPEQTSAPAEKIGDSISDLGAEQGA
jgi:uncharacterized membrane protein YccC